MAIYGFLGKNPPNLKIWRNNSASAIVRNLPKSSAIQTICHQSAKGHHARAMESRRRAGSSTPSRKFSAKPAPKTAPAGCASGKRPANDVPRRARLSVLTYVSLPLQPPRAPLLLPKSSLNGRFPQTFGFPFKNCETIRRGGERNLAPGFPGRRGRNLRAGAAEFRGVTGASVVAQFGGGVFARAVARVSARGGGNIFSEIPGESV